MVACLDEYDPKTLSIDPIESRDLLKMLYQQLFPETVRHDLGEYYTPDWLAELVIERVGYDGNPDKRVLDPACGSGTFLVMAINKVRDYADKHMIPKHELLLKDFGQYCRVRSKSSCCYGRAYQLLIGSS